MITILKGAGWEQSPVAGIFWKCNSKGVVESIIAQYVDDLIIVSMLNEASLIAKTIASHIACKAPEPLGRFVGSDYSVVGPLDHPTSIWCGQQKYTKSLQPGPGKPPQNPLPKQILSEEDTSPPLPPSGTKPFRKLLGELMYVSYCTRPDLAFGTGYLSRWNAQPTERAMRLLCGLVRYAQATSDRGILLQPPTVDQTITVDMYVDAAGGSDTNPHPQTGWILYAQGRPLIWKTRKQQRVARSINRGELLAFEDALDYVSHILPFFRKLWKRVVCKIYSDSAGVLTMLKSRSPSPQERSLRDFIRQIGGKVCVVPALAARDGLRHERIHASHIPGPINPADHMTKPTDNGQFHEHLKIDSKPWCVYEEIQHMVADGKVKALPEDDDEELPLATSLTDTGSRIRGGPLTGTTPPSITARLDKAYTPPQRQGHPLTSHTPTPRVSSVSSSQAPTQPVLGNSPSHTPPVPAGTPVATAPHSPRLPITSTATASASAAAGNPQRPRSTAARQPPRSSTYDLPVSSHTRAQTQKRAARRRP